MTLKLKYFAPIAIFLILVGFFAVGLKLDPREVPSPLVGKPSPQFSAPILTDGKENGTFSNKDMLGQVWLLNVWASWCTACKSEHHILLGLKEQGITMVGLNYKDANSDANDVLKNDGNPYTTVVTDQDGKIGIDYGVYGVPETYVIDKTGVIQYKQIGPLTEEALVEKIIPLIKGLK